jgi:hypothetical protein
MRPDLLLGQTGGHAVIALYILGERQDRFGRPRTMETSPT